jgi:hypothetical protein
MHGTVVALVTGLRQEVPERWVGTHPHQRRLVGVVNDCGVSVNRPKLRAVVQQAQQTQRV